ncbi:MAG: YggT family protein [Firmicutes bacterium]|nr:YggT family protein [Bacillota bacterium]
MVGLVDFVARCLSLLILLRVAVAWLDPRRETEYHGLLYRLTEPILAPFRRLFYRRGMRFDLSPLVALLTLELVREMVLRLFSPRF